MRTTFLGLKKPFLAWIEGQWQEIKPYTAREVIDFPAPLGQTGVYWFDMPETYTFAESFQVQNVITKFGSIPDFYNHLTWITAHIFPDAWVESSRGIEFFSQVSYRMTEVTDKFSGIGVAMLAKVAGWQGQQKAVYQACRDIEERRAWVAHTLHYKTSQGDSSFGDLWLPITVTSKGLEYGEVIGEGMIPNAYSQPISLERESLKSLYRLAAQLLDRDWLP